MIHSGVDALHVEIPPGARSGYAQLGQGQWRLGEDKPGRAKSGGMLAQELSSKRYEVVATRTEAMA